MQILNKREATLHSIIVSINLNFTNIFIQIKLNNYLSQLILEQLYIYYMYISIFIFEITYRIRIITYILHKYKFQMCGNYVTDSILFLK